MEKMIIQKNIEFSYIFHRCPQ